MNFGWYSYAEPNTHENHGVHLSLLASRYLGDHFLAMQFSLTQAMLNFEAQHCNAEILAEIIDVWAGNLAFWTKYSQFRYAAIKRSEELFLEASELEGILKLLQAFLGTPALYESLLHSRDAPSYHLFHNVVEELHLHEQLSKPKQATRG
eukprot:130516-Amphidinium_carterae.1